MHTHPTHRGPALALTLGLWLAAGPAAAASLDEELYAGLLQRHTREVPDLARTRVDYAGLGASSDWKRLVDSLASVDPASLGTRRETLAFWINAYNILAIDLVVRSYPVDGIKDIGSLLFPVWKREAGRVGGEAVTLHQIEHEILRPLGDPRIHGAIVCASLSCPALRREPFTAERLDAQLDDTLRRWLADPRKGLAVDRSAGAVTLSKIFDWFDEDFADDGGTLAFAARYAPPEDRAWLEQNGARATVRYFDYDWSLNDLARANARR